MAKDKQEVYKAGNAYIYIYIDSNFNYKNEKNKRM